LIWDILTFCDRWAEDSCSIETMLYRCMQDMTVQDYSSVSSIRNNTSVQSPYTRTIAISVVRNSHRGLQLLHKFRGLSS
jgi:hypothetical protein